MVSIFSYGQNFDECYDYKLDTMQYFYIVGNGTIKDTIWGYYSDNKFSNCDFEQYRKLIYKLNQNELLTSCKKIEIQFDPLLEGHYRNGKKAGKWKYYFDSGTDYCWEQVIWTDYTIVYNPDTIVFTEYSRDYIKIKYTSDSSVISGYIKPFGSSLINFKCTKTNGCYFLLDSSSIELTTCKYDDFEIILNQIRYGMFNREIKIIENIK